jgi:23S rRNA (uracil1939-C5)-methyltransferase
VRDDLELTPTGWAHGGETIARLDGKAVFLPDALPGERVLARIVDDRRSWARAELVEVLQGSDDRVEAPCPVYGECGGCQWQHVAYTAQLAAKRQILESQLEHLGGLEAPPVRDTVAPGPPFGYRNRMTFRVAGGQKVMHRRGSRAHVAIPACLLLAPPLADLYVRLGELDGVSEVTLRAGVRTGDTLVVLRGRLPDAAGRWGSGVVQIGGTIGPKYIHEDVAGTRFRISAGSFFQVNTDGAEELVRLVREAIDPDADDVLLDGYAGVGLFSATLPAGRLIAVESHLQAVADLRRNLSGRDARIVAGRFESGIDDTWDVAVVDPPEAGLGDRGVEVVTSGHPRAIAYVACDPASLARDSRALTKRGYRLRWAAPIDMFPQTFHVETVASFVWDV